MRRCWPVDNGPVGALPSGAETFSEQGAVRAEMDAPGQPDAPVSDRQCGLPGDWLDNHPHADLTLVARFKPIARKEDESGGLIFRLQDKDNYYICEPTRSRTTPSSLRMSAHGAAT
jgi:hypothetical protein